MAKKKTKKAAAEVNYKELDPYSKNFKIYTESDSDFDTRMREFAIQIIEQAVEEFDKPFIRDLSSRLGIQRNRLRRLLHALGIRDWYEIEKTKKLAVANMLKRRGLKK